MLWWENLLIGELPGEDWLPEKLNFLVGELLPWIVPDSKSLYHRVVLAIRKVVVTPYYIKDTRSFSMTANTFGLHISTVAKIIKDVCCAIACNLGPKYVHLPQTKDAMIEQAADFEAKYGKCGWYTCSMELVTIIRPADH